MNGIVNNLEEFFYEAFAWIQFEVIETIVLYVPKYVELDLLTLSLIVPNLWWYDQSVSF